MSRVRSPSPTPFLSILINMEDKKKEHKLSHAKLYKVEYAICTHDDERYSLTLYVCAADDLYKCCVIDSIEKALMRTHKSAIVTSCEYADKCPQPNDVRFILSK